MIVQVIESRAWRNKVTGATASIYGACPWVCDADKVNWEIYTRGWTWRCANGTVGLGRKPAATYEEAVEVMNAHNNRIGRKA